ncbi:MAG: hypothetical protein M3131_07100 [Actinomycetota bacterium]|nr:hypothetical protein [Actinomycetota bacterium]
MGGKTARSDGGGSRSASGRARSRAAITLRAVFLVVAVVTVPADGASAEQASQPMSAGAAQLDVSAGGDASGHTCALLPLASARCWGFFGAGRLGYPGVGTVGDNETPGSVGPVDLGFGRRIKAISAGAFHSCAILDDDSVRCWGFGGEGRLGYRSTNTIGDDETPGSAGPVDLGSGHTAKAITAGGGHSCAILDDDSVRCWGFGSDGRLGYGKRDNIGDDEPPGDAGPVYLGPGRNAKAISAGQDYTCAVLDDGSVRCWGFAGNGQLGYGEIGNPDADEDAIGDDETPGTVRPVDLGTGRTATAISAGSGHTCALLNAGSVRCWGFGGNGRLGYADATTIGDDEGPGSAGPVDLGGDATATAISVGDSHSCALLADGKVRCWGYAVDGRVGYANTSHVGDDETPGSVGPLDLGPGRAAVAISAGGRHSCARLDDTSLRCWGSGANGRLGYCNEATVGDDEVPASVGPVPVELAVRAPSSAYPGCARAAGPAPRGGDAVSPLEAEAARRRAYRSCLTKAARHARREIGRARRSSGRRRARLKRHIRRHRSRLRGACVKRYGRTPGRVTGLNARAVSRTKILLSFKAPGSEGNRPPPARTYLVKQSRRPIRDGRGFRRAQALCKGHCRLRGVTQVGGEVTLTVEDLRPRTTYYYAVAARDNVSRRLGPRSRAVRARTR